MTALSRFFLALSCLGSLTACGDNNSKSKDETPTERVTLGSAQAGPWAATLLADRPLTVGLNDLYLEVKRDGVVQTTGAVVATPLMTMVMDGGAMEHSAPTIQPAVDAVEGLFHTRVVFTMASSEHDSWLIEFEVGEGDALETLAFDVEVASSNRRWTLALGDAGSAVVTLTFAEPLRVGQNPYILSVHRKADDHGMVWAGVEDLDVTVTPDMPAMGHGSPGNLQPNHTGGGLYEGSVNLTMPGAWRLIIQAARGGTSFSPIELELSL